MFRGLLENRFAVVLIMIAISVVSAAIWKVFAIRMEEDFRRALTDSRVDSLPPDLLGKTWSAQELATVDCVKVMRSTGRHGALSRLILTFGQDYVSGRYYAYQAMITDSSTGKRHVFGYTRSAPRHWRWETVTPESMLRHLEQNGTVPN